VLQLSERIPNNANYKLYADNFFTSIDIIRHLLQKGIFYSGTIRKNRMRKCPLVTNENEKRGTINEIVTGDDKIVITQWSDNKVVYMASSLVGKGETGVVERWSKTEKKFVNVVRPEVVKCYNSSMGGVYKTDFLVQLYRIFIRSRKWTLRVVFHFINLAITNSWLEYKRDVECKAVPKKEQKDLLEFSFDIAEALAKSGVPVSVPKRGRPSNEIHVPASYKKRIIKEIRPIDDIRYDNVSHWPTISENQGRCKRELCTQISKTVCEKCNVHLCLTKNNNCFKDFHSS
jgi:hypothetical protein